MHIKLYDTFTMILSKEEEEEEEEELFNMCFFPRRSARGGFQVLTK